MQPNIKCTICGTPGPVAELMPVQLRHPTQMEYLAPVYFACADCRKARAKKWKRASWSATRLDGADSTVYAQQLSTFVITLTQPYAWLVVQGYKDCENRTWASNFQGRILIHASKAVGDDYAQLCDRIFESYGVSVPPADEIELGGIVGVAHFSKMVFRSGAKGLDWFTGPRAWPINWARPFAAPIAARGMPGIWRVKDQLAIKL